VYHDDRVLPKDLKWDGKSANSPFDKLLVGREHFPGDAAVFALTLGRPGCFGMGFHAPHVSPLQRLRGKVKGVGAAFRAVCSLP
jgi:hypothetical protein